MARPSAKNIITDNMDKIEQWVAAGLSMKDIAHNLGVSERTLYKYKSQDAQFTQTVKKAREPAIEKIENAMFNSATGFTRKVMKHEKVKRCIYKDGKKQKEWEEIISYEEEIYFKPDITAGIFLLKNWAKYMNEPRALELREQEIELQRKKLEDSGWS